MHQTQSHYKKWNKERIILEHYKNTLKIFIFSIFSLYPRPENPPANSTFETICFTLLKSIICQYCWLLIKAAASWIYGWYWYEFHSISKKSNICSGCTKHIYFSKNSMNIVAVSKLWHVWSFKKGRKTLLGRVYRLKKDKD